MTYSKDWRSFPPAFVTLIRQAHVRRVDVPCVDAREAKRLEGKLHAFMGVLHRAAERSKGVDLELTELDNLSRRVQIKAKDGLLVCVPRDLEPDNMLVQAALDRLAGTVPASESEPVRMSAEMSELFAKTLTTPSA